MCNDPQNDKTYALTALALKKVFSIKKLSSRNCEIMIAGEYIPAVVRAAPKDAPARAALSAVASMLTMGKVFE